MRISQGLSLELGCFGLSENKTRQSKQNECSESSSWLCFVHPSSVARNLSPRQAKGNPGTLCPGVGAQRRQEEGERFTFAHCWNTSSWLGAESGAGLPQTPPDLILTSENSEWDGYLNSRHLPQLPGTRSALLPLDL